MTATLWMHRMGGYTMCGKSEPSGLRAGGIFRWVFGRYRFAPELKRETGIPPLMTCRVPDVDRYLTSGAGNGG